MLPHCARDLSTHGSVKPCAGSRGCSPLAFCNQAPARKCGKGKGSSEALRGDEAANRLRRLRQTALGTGRTFIHFPSDASLLSQVFNSSWLVSRTESTVRDGPMERSGTSQSTRQNVGILPFKPKSRTVRDGPREFRVNKTREQSRVPKYRSRKEPVIRIIK